MIVALLCIILMNSMPDFNKQVSDVAGCEFCAGLNGSHHDECPIGDDEALTEWNRGYSLAELREDFPSYEQVGTALWLGWIAGVLNHS